MMEQTNAQMRAVVLSQGEMRHGEVFQRWGPEVHSLLANVAVVTPQVVDQAVDMVRGRHAKEIQEEVIQQRVAQMVQGGSLLRPGAAGAPAASAPAVNLDALPPRYAEYLKHAGITPSKLDEYLFKVGPQLYPGLSIEQAREAWFKEATSGDIVTEVTTKLPELRSA